MDGEVRRHEFRGVVRLQVARLVCYPRITSRVRFVERVRSELLPFTPYVLQYLRIVSVGLATGHELVFERRQHGNLFLTHGLAELIALAAGEVSQQTAEQHDLLLIDGDTISVIEVFLHDGDIVRHRFDTLFALDELRYIIHRSRTIEGVHGDEITDDGGFQFAQIFLHTGRLELEHSYCATLLEKFVSQFIVNGYMIDVDIDATCFLDITQALLDDRERDESKEVHLNQTHRLHHMAVVFGNKHTFLTGLIFYGTQRREVRQVIRTDDHAASMYAHLADCSFQSRCIFQHRPRVGITHLVLALQFLDVLIAVAQVHLWLFCAFGQTFEHRIREITVGDHSFQLVHPCQRHLLYTTYICQRRFSCHLTVGHDVCHVGLTVFLTHIIQHFATTAIFEVGIDIG